MKFLRNTFAAFHLLLIATLALSCAAFNVDPRTLWWVQLFGLAFPILYVTNLSFLLVWVFRRKKFALVPLFAAALSFKQAAVSFAVNTGENSNNGVKLMTWNVKNFDLYNWSHNTQTRKRMLDVIQNENPDIICFQEFYTDNQRIFDNLGYFRDTLGYHVYFNTNGDLIKPKWRKKLLHQEWGLAIASRFPIVHQGAIEFANAKSNGCSFVDLQIGRKVVRVYTAHLQSIKLNYDDYENLEEMEQSGRVRWYDLDKIVRKMKSAYIKRATQVELINQSLENCPYPYLLTGDFNDVPVSYSYRTLASDLSDAFTQKGLGIGGTLPGKFGFFRIDYVLASKGIEFESYGMMKKKLSDHYPIVVGIELVQ